MTDRNIPFDDYSVDEPFDYWDRGSRAEEYRFSRIVSPGRKPEIDEGEELPEFGVRYRF